MLEFIDAVSPAAVVISGTRRPAHQRPPTGWAEKIQQRDITLFDQLETGAVELTFSRRRLRMKAFLGDQSLRLNRAD